MLTSVNNSCRYILSVINKYKINIFSTLVENVFFLNIGSTTCWDHTLCFYTWQLILSSLGINVFFQKGEKPREKE